MRPSALMRRWVIERLDEAGNDGEIIARRVARDLKRVFGDRLVRVILFGSWAPSKRARSHAAARR